jgi:hypothetical protein
MILKTILAEGSISQDTKNHLENSIRFLTLRISSEYDDDFVEQRWSSMLLLGSLYATYMVRTYGMLCYTILYYTILHYTILFFTVPVALHAPSVSVPVPVSLSAGCLGCGGSEVRPQSKGLQCVQYSTVQSRGTERGYISNSSSKSNRREKEKRSDGKRRLLIHRDENSSV